MPETTKGIEFGRTSIYQLLRMDKVNKLPVGVTLVGLKYTDKFLFQLIDTCFNNEKKYYD